MTGEGSEHQTQEVTRRGKVADRPHYVSIVLSIIAVVISCLSWWESHRGRLINEEANRPVLSLENVTAELHTLEKDEGERINFELHLKNIGKVTATVFKVDMLAMLDGSSPNCDTVNEREEDGSTEVNGEYLEIAPGEEDGLLRSAVVTKSCDSPTFRLSIASDYAEPNGKTFFQHLDKLITVSLPELRRNYKKQWAGLEPTPSPTNHRKQQ